jgi:hypothetical protein
LIEELIREEIEADSTPMDRPDKGRDPSNSLGEYIFDEKSSKVVCSLQFLTIASIERERSSKKLR